MKDLWGFQTGTKASFLIGAIEAGDETKESIRLLYSHKFDESSGASGKKSTFDTYLIDFPKMFASDRMASRAIRIDTNLKGHLCFNPERAKLIKTAIKDGLLKEVKSIEKRDERAIEAILDRFGVPLR